ncbi:MAG TPA: Ku protein [Acidimicrobiia bacterium]|nr:Ku protein [Acidimicrobiia bacterium]
MPRSLRNGSVSFGLVNVPIALYTAIEPKDIHFHQMTKSGHRIRQKRVDEKTGREVEYKSIVKGYEQSKGKYVMVEPEEIDAAAPKQTRAIEIEEFVDLAEIDPIYYNSTYYVAPGKGAGADKGYALLRDVMEKSGRAAIGRFVMRTKQYLAAIRVDKGTLVLHTLYFADEIRDTKGLGIPSRTKAGDREVRIARQLVDSLTVEWDPKRHKDTYRADVEKIIAKKAKGQEITYEEPEEQPAGVIDLVAALQASLDAKKPRKAAKKAPARKRKAS